MKKEDVIQWTDALRSGEYEQGQYELKCDNKYCCLGVLAEIHGRLILDDACEEVFYIQSDEGEGGVIKMSSFLPRSFCDEIELDRDFAWELSAMNDLGDSFTTIADYIEKHLL